MFHFLLEADFYVSCSNTSHNLKFVCVSVKKFSLKFCAFFFKNYAQDRVTLNAIMCTLLVKIMSVIALVCHKMLNDKQTESLTERIETINIQNYCIYCITIFCKISTWRDNGNMI